MKAWTHKRRIMRRYNQSARVYDAQYSDEQEAKIKAIMQSVHLPRDSRVLDAGCGSGLLFKDLVGRTRLIVGIDTSRNLLQEARRKAQRYRNVAVIMADADSMPFGSETFDAVFAVTLLQNTPNPRITLNELSRVSTRNASIAVTGLRKQFTRDGFVKMLHQAALKIDTLKLDENNREYVCVCRKARR